MALRVQRGAGQRLEVDVEEADVADLPVCRAALAAPAVDEINDRVADALDRRDVQLAWPGDAGITPGAERYRPFVGALGVLNAQRDRADAGAVQPGKTLGE